MKRSGASWMRRFETKEEEGVGRRRRGGRAVVWAAVNGGHANHQLGCQPGQGG